MWVTCALGPYNFKFMTDVKLEIMSRYNVDGIFINRWDGSGMCYCEHCRENFKTATGQELPRTNDPQNLAAEPTFSGDSNGSSNCGSFGTGKSGRSNPNSCVIPNTGGGATSSLDMKRIGELAPR